ncbi:UNVERIFIED_CONTAM: hypothetical protein FKN15_042543 [Acipenser sinensis]
MDCEELEIPGFVEVPVVVVHACVVGHANLLTRPCLEVTVMQKPGWAKMIPFH